MRAKAPWHCLDAVARLALLSLCWLMPAQAAPSGDTLAAGTTTEPVVVSLVLNGSLLAEAQLLHRETGPGSQRLWLPEKEAGGWRLDIAGRARRNIEGADHAAFCGTETPRDRCFYDEASALLTMTLDNGDLLPLRVLPAQPGLDALADTPGYGGYLNYDVSSWHIGRMGVAALLDGRVYTPHGHGALRLGGVWAGGNGRRTLAQGLWQVDDVQRGVSVQAGSIVVPDTALAAGLPVTGFRIGSNARLRPAVSNLLRPVISGLAERSLRADVFVDGLFRQTAQVPYGPYSVEVQPNYAGRGAIDLVSTDITGVQARSSLAYYQAPQMLAQGATEWSADVGALADDGGPALPNHPLLGSAALRYGLSPELTTQAQLLLAPEAARLAVALDSVHALFGLVSSSLIWQRTPTRPRGRVWLSLGHEYLSRTWSATVKAEQTISGCLGDGASPPTPVSDALGDRLSRPCGHVALALGTSPSGRWSADATIDAAHDSSGRASSVATFGARYQASARSQLGLSFQRLTIGGKTTQTLLVTWSQPLQSGHDAQLSLVQPNQAPAQLHWSAQSQPPTDTSAATNRLQTYGTVGPHADIGARWTQRAEQAEWHVESWADRRGVSGSAGVAGAIGYAEGRMFKARRIDDAFVLVDVGLPDLPVLLDNREVARTNAAGWAIVTEARAHQANNIGVDVAALPIEYAMPRDQQSVVPALAAGVLARFDVSDGGLAIAVRDEQGQALPAGAVVRISSQRLPTAVTSRGEVFLERSDRAAQIEIRWSGQACRFEYRPQAEPEGAYRCTAS